MEIGAYHLQLRAFLERHHPDKIFKLSSANLNEYIHERAKNAAATFESNRLAGMDVTEANEVALQVLYSGLEFSPFDLLKDIIEEEYPDYLFLLENMEETAFIEGVMLHFDPIIATYYDSEGNPTEPLAKFILIGEMKTYLKKVLK